MTDNVGEVSHEQGFSTPDKGRFMEEEALDDDGRARRTGTVWTATAHIITAVIGSGVLSLAWAIAQLGWIAGPETIFLFSFITFFTSTLLADCYRSPHPVYGKRNYTYTDAVRANLGSGSLRFSSQIPNLHKLSWLSIVAAFMSFGYSLIGVGLALAKVISGNTGKTSITGADVGADLSESQKVWTTFRALGDIAFAYSYSFILIEIQVFCQPLFAAVESWTAKKWPNAKFIVREHTITWKSCKYKFSTFRLLWRTIFIVITTTLAMILPFFNDILALLGAVGFWPLTVYFPVEMYISKKKIRRFTPKWTMLQLLSFICLLGSLAAACGSIEGVIEKLRVYEPFQTKQ
ncbi:hypothetical protein MRB53_012915 [Persea americana]|uniref:Uncharacterized protein n=1 Tax=Persea americana TaxID=3435 RepID=A0ACC2LZ32_PERAE|nr:hypothetical protein MRB53_012915 [Persea americana]